MSESYNDKVIGNLQRILDTKDLSRQLIDQALGLIGILSDENITEDKKHFTRILAEELISSVRDFPDIKVVNKNK